MKKYIIENAEVYTVQYEVEANCEEDALTEWTGGNAKEIDHWQVDDLSEVVLGGRYKKLIAPSVYEGE